MEKGAELSPKIHGHCNICIFACCSIFLEYSLPMYNIVCLKTLKTSLSSLSLPSICPLALTLASEGHKVILAISLFYTLNNVSLLHTCWLKQNLFLPLGIQLLQRSTCKCHFLDHISFEAAFISVRVSSLNSCNIFLYHLSQSLYKEHQPSCLSLLSIHYKYVSFIIIL